ncbi:MAG: hypothetical protein ABIS86_17010 [Streptosporangiaceae bacterium]
MTATTILQVMKGLETRLKTIEGLRTSYFVADQINPPHAVIGVPPVENYRASFGRGQFIIKPQVFILVSAALDWVGQTALAGYADVSGPLSIPAAIEADRTLGGVVDECVVDSFRPLGAEEVGVINYFGGVFDLRVIASGT